MLYWPRLILRHVSENWLLYYFKYFIIYFIYSISVVISCCIVFFIKLVCFSHEDFSLLRENIFENTCYIRACLREFWGTCANLLNHPLESNNAYFLSASITWCCALKRCCSQEEKVSEVTEKTWKCKKKNWVTARWKHHNVNNKPMNVAHDNKGKNTVWKFLWASSEGWCQFGCNFRLNICFVCL